jgi:type II secretory pathway pseudopilin PulG
MKGNTYKAFSLVELMVSIAIMGTMSIILLWNYPDSNIRIKLINFTQTVALLIREVQIRGSAIESHNGEFSGYGLHFSIASVASSSEVVLFADRVIADNYVNGILVGDGLMSTSTNDEIKSITTFPTGYTISKLCVESGAQYYCDATTTPEIQTLTLSFVRPSSQPHIYVNDDKDIVISNNGVDIDAPYTGACIELSTIHAPTEGHVRSVRIQGAGFITTKVTGCE